MKSKFTEKPIIESAPFNMAMLFYIELHKLREYKSRMKIGNDIDAYYEAIEEISSLISFKLNPEENADVEADLKKIRDRLSRQYSGSIAGRLKFNDRMLAKNAIRLLDKKLNRCMHKYNMIFPKIEMPAGLKALDERYGLGLQQ